MNHLRGVKLARKESQAAGGTACLLRNGRRVSPQKAKPDAISTITRRIGFSSLGGPDLLGWKTVDTGGAIVAVILAVAVKMGQEKWTRKQEDFARTLTSKGGMYVLARYREDRIYRIEWASAYQSSTKNVTGKDFGEVLAAMQGEEEWLRFCCFGRMS